MIGGRFCERDTYQKRIYIYIYRCSIVSSRIRLIDIIAIPVNVDGDVM